MAIIRSRIADHGILAFEANVHRVGQRIARKAFSRAINHEGRKAHTAIKRILKKRTSINLAHIAQAVKFRPASDRTLMTIVTGAHVPISLRYFGPRQFRYGVRATVWGRPQRYNGAFIVKSLGGTVFKNTRQFNKKSRRKNAIEKLWGPIIPREMITNEVEDAFNGHLAHIASRAGHELNRILNA